MERRDELEIIGARLADDLLEWTWIRRRVEEITFLDNRTFCRHVSVHFDLPGLGKTTGGNYIVPLTLMHKEAVTNLDFIDEDQRRLSVLTADERSSFSFGVLRVAALNAAGQKLLDSRPEIDDDLRAVAQPDRDDALASLDCLLRRGDNATGRVDNNLWAALQDDPLFSVIARTLARQSPVLVEMSKKKDITRRLVSFSYNERVMKRSVGHAKRFGRAVGWSPHCHLIPTPGLAHGGTYHLVVPAPKGIKATEHSVQLLSSDSEPPADGGRIMWREFDTLHVILKRVRRGVSGVAEVAWRPRLTFPLQAWLTTLAILATLLVLGANLGRLTEPTRGSHLETIQNAAALLLLIPGLLAGYLANERNPVERSLTLGIQVALVSAGFCCFVGALVLAVGLAYGPYGVAWWAATSASGIVALILSRTLMATILEDMTIQEWWRERPQRRSEGGSDF